MNIGSNLRERDLAWVALVVATTYDPATPYRGGLRLVEDLGNARLSTMRGGVVG